MLAAWGNTTEEDEASEEEEAAVALMARSESDSDDEPIDSLSNSRKRYVVLTRQNLRNCYLL